ncbi:hypothetical protein MTO96_052272 [Rhipicephalus appendiculatus]
MLKSCLFFAHLAVGLGVASLHRLTAVGNTDGRCSTATSDGFTSGAFRRSWDDLVTSSPLGRNSPGHSCAYTASPVCLPVDCYASSGPVPTQARYLGQINPPKRRGKGPYCGITSRLLTLIKAI